MTKRFKPIFTITNRITAGLTRIERARGFLEATTLSKAWAREKEVGPRPLVIIQGFARLCPEVDRRSLQRDMKAKVDMGLLVSEGSTNKLVCRVKETD
jgi:hypothetical protein